MQDNGKGMPHDDIPNMFGRGFPHFLQDLVIITWCGFRDSKSIEIRVGY